MNEDIMTMLDEVIINGLEDLSTLTPGSEEEKVAVDNIAKLYKLRIEDSKVAMEYNNEMDENDYKQKQMESEEQIRKEQMAEQRIDRYIRIGIAAAELTLPLIFYGIWMKRGFEFEKEGIYTSTTFRNLISRFRPTKK